MTSALSSRDKICRGSLLTLKVMGTQTHTRGKHDFYQRPSAVEKKIGFERWPARGTDLKLEENSDFCVCTSSILGTGLKRDQDPLFIRTEWSGNRSLDGAIWGRMLKCTKVQFVNRLEHRNKTKRHLWRDYGNWILQLRKYWEFAIILIRVTYHRYSRFPTYNVMMWSSVSTFFSLCSNVVYVRKLVR